MSALATTLYEKVWGSKSTEPWLKNSGDRKIGEIWFAASREFPLLVKLLFTSDRMSVQVHPDDTYARLHENSSGKTEMWHVLRAEPDSRVALGLRGSVTKDRLREAAQSGEIEELLNWIPARNGDTFFVPAGTIHAIGAGLVVCEVQQLSDVTYRLYDYGRPRELHLDHGLNVATLEPWMPQSADCKYFRTEVLTVEGTVVLPGPLRNTLYVALEGEGRINGDAFQAGEAHEIPANSGPVSIEGSRVRFLKTSAPTA
jgi:mannose-6-phosphate isomerase